MSIKLTAQSPHRVKLVEGKYWPCAKSDYEVHFDLREEELQARIIPTIYKKCKEEWERIGEGHCVLQEDDGITTCLSAFRELADAQAWLQNIANHEGFCRCVVREEFRSPWCEPTVYLQTSKHTPRYCDLGDGGWLRY